MLASFVHIIPWTLIFIPAKFFGISLYYIKEREDCQRIQKKINNFASHITDGGKGYGYSFGYWYALSLSISERGDGNNYTCYMIATKESFEYLTKNTDTPIQFPGKMKYAESIGVIERCGSYQNPYYRRRDLTISLTPRRSQQVIMDEVVREYNETGHVITLLHGPPGTGKSMIGILITNVLKGIYCNSLKPWQPGDTLAYIYNDCEPTREKPLVIVFDEFDGPLLQIHKGNIVRHKDTPISVEDKAGWNKMLDEIQRGMYPNLILLLTTNKTPDFIRQLDPSYIREGRVNHIFEIC
jgi:hypothetical protein